MTSMVIVVGLAVLAAAIALIVVLRRVRRLPGTDWYRVPGAAFAAEQELRRERYAVAREDATRLAAVVASAAAGLERDWQQPTAGIARELVEGTQECVTEMLRRLDARERGASNLTIVLYGRTKAGKSSLFAALAGRGFEGVGDGRQNFTREIRSENLGSVHLIDAPGVDGVGSEPLEALTADAVHESDVLVIQVTDDAVFAEDFDRLSALGASARPVVVALNVKQANLQRLINEPAKVFRKRRLGPHIARLRKALPRGAHDETQIVVYHALAAERARRARGKHRVALWSESRVGDVINAVCAAEHRAREFALISADEAVVAACDRSLEKGVDAADEVDARVRGLKKTIAEIKGILRETEARKRIGAELVDAHFASAEQQLLGALDLKDARSFKSRADKVLSSQALNTRLKEALDEAADLLQEKFNDFQADVRLAGQMSVGRDGLDELHGHRQRERRAREAAEEKARKRRWWRRGAKVAGSVAAALAAETVLGTVAVAAVAERAINTLLPEVEVPSDDPTQRVARIRSIIDRSSQEATRVFERALEEQILEPARAQLLRPLCRQVNELGELRRAIDDMNTSVGEIRLAAADRRDATPGEEQVAA